MQEQSEAAAQAQAGSQVLARAGNDTAVASLCAWIYIEAFPMDKKKRIASVLCRKESKYCRLCSYYCTLLISHCSTLSHVYEAALDFLCTFFACSHQVDVDTHTPLLCCPHGHKSKTCWLQKHRIHLRSYILQTSACVLPIG